MGFLNTEGRSEHEPAEPDPEADLPDPERDLVPEVGVAESDVPPDLLSLFWTLILVVNAAVLAIAVGGIWFIFRGDLRTSAALVGGGLVLLWLAVRRYRRFRLEDDADPYGEQ